MKVTVLNVNYGKNIKLMERCETMGKYGNNDFGKLIHNINRTEYSCILMSGRWFGYRRLIAY